MYLRTIEHSCFTGYEKLVDSGGFGVRFKERQLVCSGARESEWTLLSGEEEREMKTGTFYGRLRRIVFVLFVLGLFPFCIEGCGSSSSTGAPAKNVILFIGDGMGFAHLEAARYYESGGERLLPFETFPFQSAVRTTNASGEITDSAAAATAMATGQKVSNSVISRMIPGDGSDLETVLEVFAKTGKRTGLVSTTVLTDATPGAFGAHADARTDSSGIANFYLNITKPDLLSGGSSFISPDQAIKAGYTVVTDGAGLSGLTSSSQLPVAGLFGSGPMPYELDGLGDLPSLSEQTSAALRLFSDSPDGFFLLVEGARIDHASHSNDIERAVLEVLEFSNAVSKALSWARGRDDTIILVTADHECGGLTVEEPTLEGIVPSVSWSATYHTDVDVPLFGWGQGAQGVSQIGENTQIHRLILHAAGIN